MYMIEHLNRVQRRISNPYKNCIVKAMIYSIMVRYFKVGEENIYTKKKYRGRSFIKNFPYIYTQN